MNSIDLANKVRIDTLKMTSKGGSSHIGSILSICDILAVLYSDVLRVKPDKPDWNDRDRFILSKGHAGAAVYATLANIGFFDTELLMSHYQNGSLLSGHVSHKGIPGIELSTGSLGHGLSVATGIALAAKLDAKQFRSFCLLSDGEMDEGSNWEPIMFASHHNLDNLVAIVDYNKLQSLGSVSETLALEPFGDKWTSFGWHVVELDGHNHAQMMEAFHQIPAESGKPTVFICNTTKGKGVSFMENSVLWHYRTAKGEEFDSALKELQSL